jgi:G3E family GTPase
MPAAPGPSAEHAPIPVTVIGGYLGAGKTTLVNHLLRNARGLKLAVLVNDFGTLPIDADLIEAQDGNVIGIAGGCVCCSYGSDLMQALMDLETRVPRPEHVLLETSGVALPGQVASAVTLLACYALDAVVTLADASTVCEHGADRYLADTISRQLADAHLVLLNKADLVDVEQLGEVERWVSTMAPRARVLVLRQAAAPIEVVLGSRLGEAAAYSQASRAGHAHAHGAAYATEAFELAPVADAKVLADTLCDPALGILRAKGVVTTGDGIPWLIQIVGTHADVTPARGNIANTRGFVVIGLASRLDLITIRARLDACCSSPA